MQVITKLPEKLYHDIINNKKVYAKTDWSNHDRFKAYRHISAISKLDNFFFGMIYDENNKDHLLELINYSNNNNSITLKLELPDNFGYIHDYYNFSDLIYYTDCEPNKNLEKELVDLLKEKPKSKYKQIIYPYIDKSFIIEII